KTNFNVRRAAIRFLTALLTNCTEELQDIILESGPAGFSKLLDLLEDKREVIRNDALLLFQVLIRSNWCIQGIFVLEYGFERLLRILVSKYGSDGNVTIEDCLSIILTLFESNQSNQSYFRRRSYIPRLFSFFERGLIGEKLWSIQKVTNIHLLLKIIQTLVSPTNSNENIIACQRTVKQCGILRRLCIMLMLTTVPDDILSETINTIADIVRGNIENQQFLGSIMDITAEVQQPIFFNMLCVMAADKKQSFRLRISILYCVQCYLYNNDFGKSMIVQTLFPQTENVANQYTFGHILMIGYLSKDIVASWCSGIALSHLIADSQLYKEALLKVRLVVDQSKTDAKTLMEISIDLLQNSSSSFCTRIAVLIFLCTWLSNCSLAVQTLFSIENSISYLVSQICTQSIADDRELFIQSLCSFALGLCLVFNNNQIQLYSTESLVKLIDERIRIDSFLEKLGILSKSEFYAKALQKPQLKLSKSSDMILDYEFAHLYETLQSLISHMLTRHDINSTVRTLIDPMSTKLYAQRALTMMTDDNDFIGRVEQININKLKEKQWIEERDIDKKKILALEQQIQEIKDKNA
ncbi:unnamed protein product, partial [Rotaria sp. Silwood2]